ncbi:MAG: XrtA system polysaccharide deacetylase [Desulfobulbus sp.]|jgi:polysaccharide deacetylase family protein (PEP-CTERM system associated)
MQTIQNYLTIDVEDYFQVSAFEDVIAPHDWASMEHRVVANTERVLEVLAMHQVKATFFVVGWIADTYPNLVRSICDQGHAIGCHSYWHRKVYDLGPDEFKADTRKAKELLEDITGAAVLGYRAPSYSITSKSLWAIDILRELGFLYDSSIFPIYHDTYGIPDAPRFPYRHPNGLVEYPMSTALVFGRKVPVSGGGYFRLFPYALTRQALRRVNVNERKAFVFYLHPWELDPEQPRVRNARFLSKFRHYNNLNRTEPRLHRLLSDFSFMPLPGSFE